MTRRLEQLSGISLMLIGACFLALLAFLKVTGELSDDLKVSAFMLVVGIMLTWIGYKFLRGNADQPNAQPLNVNGAVRSFTKLRLTTEILAAIGSAAMLLHSMCVMTKISWPPKPALYALVAAPVLIGQVILRVLKPGALQNGVFPRETIEAWGTGLRRLISHMLRIGWLGYVAIPLAWPDIATLMPENWTQTVQVISCWLIFVLYVTQAFMLHFGEPRID